MRARYGRMRLGRCVEFDLGYIDCYTDVLTRLDKRCSGRRTCEVRIPDAEFEATGPCLKELKTYLEVSYRCVPGKLTSPGINFTRWLSALIPENIYAKIQRCHDHNTRMIRTKLNKLKNFFFVSTLSKILSYVQ